MYSQVPLDEEDLAPHIESKNPTVASLGATVALTPLNRPPAASRDALYAFLFLAHFLVLALFGLLEGTKSQEPLLSRSRTGAWTSMTMIATVLGAFFGSLLVFLLSSGDTRPLSLSQAVPGVVLVQICLANVFFLFGRQLFLIGALLLISAILFAKWYVLL
jgi:hypothetical protein